MPDYTIRIQLTGKPSEGIYEDLHERMKTEGFVRTVAGAKTRDLPHGTYFGSSNKNVLEIRDFAKKQVEDIWGDGIVFVAQTETWSWGLADA